MAGFFFMVYFNKANGKSGYFEMIYMKVFIHSNLIILNSIGPRQKFEISKDSKYWGQSS